MQGRGREILEKPIRELGLRIEGSPLEPAIAQVRSELRRRGLRRFRPGFYLTDEWGCPSGEPVIGIPFDLAHPELSRHEREVNDLESDAEILMFLRHEAGHAFNYAYALYRTKEWRRLFGPFRRPYREDYRPVPFSRQHVRHLAGWYAQKHPDEDFAETFAVWLTPGSRWRQRYADWPALVKLEYVDRIAGELGDAAPVRENGRTDLTVDEMEETVAEFYRRASDEPVAPSELPLDGDLADIVGGRRGRPAADVVRRHRKVLVDKVAYWTGVRRPTAKALVERILAILDESGHRISPTREEDVLAELSIYVTVLAMNRLTSGRFVHV